MLTVGLPTWANNDIIWMPMEGLCRQRTSYEWELIVMECDSPLLSGYELFESYWERLQKAGCKKLTYLFKGERMPLGQKWKEMAWRAAGDIFLLQASDEYPHDTRLEVTGRNGAAWYDTRYYYSYSFISKKMLLFDKYSDKNWLTGTDMAMNTNMLRNIPDNDMRKGVDFYLYGKLNGAYKVTDPILYPGLHTNGANTISTARELIYYKKPHPPYNDTKATLDDVGLPDDILERVKSFEPICYMTKFKSSKFKVLFTDDVPGTCRGQERWITSDAWLNLKDVCQPLQGFKSNYEKIIS